MNESFMPDLERADNPFSFRFPAPTITPKESNHV
jgi:hypothetical protein